ncbi:unannotated protein [freshwater metagenome]|uniref:Unannotated protein n=1 Tax=freshwater metagenome TaxID=449393 RepID=A0A6J6FJH2_9ZZZZ
MPPSEGPTAITYPGIFNLFVNATSALTMSRIVKTGNLDPQRFPSGEIEDGPVLPWQPPITFGQITKYLSVSNGEPGPTIEGHQPGTSDHPVKA